MLNDDKGIDWKVLIKDTNPYWLRQYGFRFEVLSWIMENIDNRLVKRVYEWKHPRITDHFSEVPEELNESYCNLCQHIWEVAGGPDTGGSYSNHCNYKFVSDAIMHYVEIKANLIIESKKAELLELEERAKTLRKDLGI